MSTQPITPMTPPESDPPKPPGKASKPRPKGHLAPNIKPWPALPPREDQPPLRGPDAVQHEGETRGRRSRSFPDLNISATASRIGVSKSHLSKILAGGTRPSVDVAVRLAAAMGVDVATVIDLYHGPRKKAGEEE